MTVQEISTTSKSFHVGNSHAQNGQLVRFAGKSRTRGHHVRQLGDVGRHLVPSPALYFAVVLPTTERKHRGQQREDHLLLIANRMTVGKWKTADRV